MNPEVSVIIPSFNTETYIAKAIESVLEQTEESLELIVVDDASTDNTLEIIKSFSDSRIKIFANRQNRGGNYCTNLGINAAKGNWITRLDSDDWYSPNRLEKLLKISSNHNIEMIADDIYFIEDGKQLPWSTLLAQSKFTITDNFIVEPIFFVENDLPGSWGLPLGLTKPLIKRDFIAKHQIKNQEDILIGGDFWFYLTCLAYGANFLLVPKPYYFYRSRHGSLVTLSKVKRLEAYCTATQFYLKQEFILNNSQLLAALHQRLKLIEKSRPYFKIIDSLKDKSYLHAAFQMIHEPYFFYHLCTQIPRIIYRRLFLYLNQIKVEKSE